MFCPIKSTCYAIVVHASLCLRQVFGSALRAGGAQVNCHLCECVWPADEAYGH